MGGKYVQKKEITLRRVLVSPLVTPVPTPAVPLKKGTVTVQRVVTPSPPQCGARPLLHNLTAGLHPGVELEPEMGRGCCGWGQRGSGTYHSKRSSLLQE